MKYLFSLLLISISLQISAQNEQKKPKLGRSYKYDGNNAASIGLNSEFSYKMMEQNQNLRKTTILLEERKRGELRNRSFTIGGSLISIFDYQKSNTANKFGYLMRHPTSNNQIGKEVSEMVIHSFQ